MQIMQFIRIIKINFEVFITQSYFAVPEYMRLNSTHYLLIKSKTSKNFNKLHLIIHQILDLTHPVAFLKMCFLEKG